MLLNYRKYRELVKTMGEVVEMSGQFEQNLKLLEKVINRKTNLIKDVEKFEDSFEKLKKFEVIEEFYYFICLNCFRNCGIYKNNVLLNGNKQSHLLKTLLVYEGETINDSCYNCSCSKEKHVKCETNPIINDLLDELKIQKLLYKTR